MMSGALGRIQPALGNLFTPSRTRLIFWTCLFLATRLYTLYFGLGFTWTNEEYFRGTIAKEFLGILHGQPLRLPLWQYQADTYLGGTLLVGLVTAVNYALLGVSLLSLKLTALYFGCAALIVIFPWLWKWFGASTANAFAFLYVLASPGFLSLGLVAMGFHTESVFFFACTLVLGHQISERPHGAWSFALFALVSGLGFWFSYINGITSAAVALSLGLSPDFWKRARLRMLPFASLGLLLGLLPWIYFNWHSHAAGWTALTNDFMTPENKIYYPERGLLYLKARKLFLLIAKDLAYFQRFSYRPVSYFFLGVLLLLAGGFERKRNQFLTRFFAAYALLFLVSYGITNRMIFENEEIVSHRYLLVPFFMLLIMASMQKNFRSRKFVFSAALIGCMSAWGLYGQFDTYQPLHRLNPASLATLGDKLNGYDFSRKDLPLFLRLARSYQDSEQLYFLAGLRNFDMEGASRLSDGVVQEALRSLPPAGRNFLLRRLGNIYADARLPPPPEGAFPGKASDLSQLLLGYVQTAVADNWNPGPEIPGRNRALADWKSQAEGFWYAANRCGAPPAREDSWYLRGVGEGMRGCNPSLGRAFRDIAFRHPARNLSPYSWGAGWDLREKYLQDPLRVLLQVGSLPQELRADATAGAIAFEQYFGIPPSDSILRLKGEPN